MKFKIVCEGDRKREPIAEVTLIESNEPDKGVNVLVNGYAIFLLKFNGRVAVYDHRHSKAVYDSSLDCLLPIGWREK